MSTSNGRSELDRLLYQTFVGGKAGLGDYRDDNVARDLARQDPGFTYGGGPQRQPGGPAGRKERKARTRWDRLYSGLDRSKCGPLAMEDCAEVLSRLLEATFRNAWLNTKPATWIEPPARARPIDHWTQLSGQTIAAGATESIIQGPHRIEGGLIGVLRRIGMEGDTSGSWTFLKFTLRIGGSAAAMNPHYHYKNITMQLGKPSDPTELACPIYIREGVLYDLVCENTDAVSHQVYGRLWGWQFPHNVDLGDLSSKDLLVE